MEPNTFLSLIGVVLVVAAVAGAAALQRPAEPDSNQPKTKTFLFAWRIVEETSSGMGNTDDGGTGTDTFAIAAYNVTVANVTFTADYSPPPTRQRAQANVMAELREPTGNSTNFQGVASASTPYVGEYVFQFGDPPAANVTIKAKNEPAAWTMLLEEYPMSDAGHGDWEISVSTTRSGAPCALCPLAPGTVAWSVEVVATHYLPELVQPVAGDKK